MSDPQKVDKVAVAVKHPGVFMETAEMEAETGEVLPSGIEMEVVSKPLEGKIRSLALPDSASPSRRVTRGQKQLEEGEEVVKVEDKEIKLEDETRRSTRRQKSGSESKQEEVQESNAALGGATAPAAQQQETLKSPKAVDSDLETKKSIRRHRSGPPDKHESEVASKVVAKEENETRKVIRGQKEVDGEPVDVPEVKKLTRRQKSASESKHDSPQDSQDAPGQQIKMITRGQKLTTEDIKEEGQADSKDDISSEMEVAHPKEKGGDALDDSKDLKAETEVAPKPIISTRRRRKLEEESSEANIKTPSNEPMRPNSLTDGDISEAESEHSEMKDQDNESTGTGGSDSTLTTRSGSRMKNNKGSAANSTNSKLSKRALGRNRANLKGRSRRHIFKKSATRAPTAVARTVTSDRVFYKGNYFTKGDIVSVEDVDGGIYYAQLRGFMTDQYCEKSGAITWLLPTEKSPEPAEGFDAATYVIGPEEELPRKLDCFTFVMHAPDNYFYYKNAPYPTLSHPTDQEYLITRTGPKVRIVENQKPIYKDFNYSL